jgi:hypothetical protein
MTPSFIIRGLNDQLRKSLSSPLGRWVLTPGIVERGPAFVTQAVSHVTAFDTFTEDNDPYGEHDFGSLTIDGVKVFWKIDYYDPTLTAGSEDPADAAKTHRVLTVMLASEY